jgi:hypothetical protein
MYTTSKGAVIGNLTDTSDTNNSSRFPTLMNYNKATYYHVHAPAKVYPTLADPVTLTAGEAAWELGADIEIIPANTITKPFDIHWINVHTISNNDEYELILYGKTGAAAAVEIGRIAFNRIDNFTRIINLPIQIPVQAANNRISAKLACKSANAYTAAVKIFYHEYPDQ